MSVQAMTYVIESSKQKGSALLLLIMIANYARKDGTGAWPSTQTLADDCRMSKRSVVRLLQEIEASGELTIERNAGPYRANLYTIRGMVEGDNLSSSDGDNLSSPGSEGVTDDALDGDKSVRGVTSGASDGDTGDTQSVKNRPFNPSRTSRLELAKLQHPEAEKFEEQEDGSIIGWIPRHNRWDVLVSADDEQATA